MISFDQFLQENDGVGINWDGAFGNQCWDVSAKRAALVDGCPYFPTGSIGGAVECYTVFAPPLPSFYVRIPYTPGLVPQRGWIPVWSGNTNNPYGHIAGGIVSATATEFVSFDQNWPSQGYYDQYGNFIGTGVCHYQKHNYIGVLGFLAPIKEGNQTMTDLQLDTFIAETYNKIAARNPSDAEFKFHRDQYKAQGDRWLLEMVKGFKGDDWAWKRYESAVIEGGKQIATLKEQVTASGTKLDPGKYVVQ